MPYSITLEKEITKLSKGNRKLSMWVSATNGFDDPGFFLLHRRRTLLNEDALPIFETFANPCTLVEYPYKTVDRNWGLYRDRELSIIFNNQDELDIFWGKIVERKEKLISYMTQMDDDISHSGSLQLDDITIKQSSGQRPYTKITLEAAEGNPFLFRQYCGMNLFVGIDGLVADPDGLVKGDSLSIITYTPRTSLFLTTLMTDLAER